MEEKIEERWTEDDEGREIKVSMNIGILPENYKRKLEILKNILDDVANNYNFKIKIKEMGFIYNLADREAQIDDWRYFPVGYKIVDVRKWFKKFFRFLFGFDEDCKTIGRTILSAFFDVVDADTPVYGIGKENEEEYVKNLAEKADKLTIDSSSLIWGTQENSGLLKKIYEKLRENNFDIKIIKRRFLFYKRKTNRSFAKQNWSERQES